MYCIIVIIQLFIHFSFQYSILPFFHSSIIPLLHATHNHGEICSFPGEMFSYLKFHPDTVILPCGAGTASVAFHVASLQLELIRTLLVFSCIRFLRTSHHILSIENLPVPTLFSPLFRPT